MFGVILLYIYFFCKFAIIFVEPTDSIVDLHIFYIKIQLKKKRLTFFYPRPSRLEHIFKEKRSKALNFVELNMEIACKHNFNFKIRILTRQEQRPNKKTRVIYHLWFDYHFNLIKI
jgi:hypothetical protein